MKPQATNLFETKLITHKQDPETSFAAAEKMIKSGALSRQEQWVWQSIREFNCDYGGCVQGFTAKELLEEYGLDYHLIQRRLSGLYRKGKIERVTKGYGFVKRDGCCVWRIVR